MTQEELTTRIDEFVRMMDDLIIPYSPLNLFAALDTLEELATGIRKGEVTISWEGDT
tara:strand:- start:401 stop:571 length:171 start_codon:yes stop_codon:yes gene_type:complete